jgi:nucleoside-diphosphate-sugar epimerase
MIVALTGGTGFIGRKLVDLHLVKGHEVRVFSRRALGSGAGVNGVVEWWHGDLLTSKKLQSFVDGVDILYHCAGEILDLSRMKEVHVEGTQRLIEAATGRVGRWVQLSSVGAYGKILDGIITEKTKLNPCGTYEITKVASDSLISRAALDGAFECVILRPSNVYGADMSNQSLFGLIEMINRGWFFFIGEPGAAANYIHVDNVVQALMLCGVHAEASGHVYNLSDHRTMEQFVAIISTSLGNTKSRLRLPEWPIRLSVKLLGNIQKFPLTTARVDALTGRAIYSTSKIEHELQYQHIVSMETGLSDLTESWQQRVR